MVVPLKFTSEVFDSYMNHKKVYPLCTNHLVLPVGKSTDDICLMAEFFLHVFFSCVYKELQRFNHLPISCLPIRLCLRLSPVKFLIILKAPDPNSSIVVDSFHSELLRKFTTALSEPLSILFISVKKKHFTRKLAKPYL